MTVIVVGVDGTPAGRAALEWAVDEARLRRATLPAVYAWRVPDDELHPLTQLGEGEAAARSRLRAEVAAVGPDAASVEEVALLGDPVEVIIGASRDADMVVIGSRGRGSFAALLLGSVGVDLVHRATWPVVIVPRRRANG